MLWKMKKNFSNVTICGDFNNKKQAVLLICNHISWWDGIWALYANTKVFKRKYHFMMLEEQLKKNWFFNYTGGFSINKKSKSVIETLDYAAGLLSEKNNLVLLFPQGKIFSMFDRNLVFEKGVERIIRKARQPVQIMFMANLVEYGSNVKPNVTININEFSGEKTIKTIESAYNRFYKHCIEKQIVENIQ